MCLLPLCLSCCIAMFKLFLIVNFEQLAQVVQLAQLALLVVLLPWSLRPLRSLPPNNVNMQRWNGFFLCWKLCLTFTQKWNTWECTQPSLWWRECAITQHRHSDSHNVLAQEYTEKQLCTSHFSHHNRNVHMYTQQHMPITPQDRQAAMRCSTKHSRYHWRRNITFWFVAAEVSHGLNYLAAS